ncbi:MAG: ATP-binding cassette domain-containing protein [Proteobacteria bacterium]|nr:ATP-binding cassette domain-containing protein [Pseudomonadota bacterium]
MKIMELQGVKHIYDEKKVLDISTLSIEKGQIHSIVGPNGSGKTTLISIMSLILMPTVGEVCFEERPVWSDRRSLMTARESMTMTLQSPYLFNMSVAKNVAYGLRGKGITRRGSDSRVREALELVGLTGFEKRRARELSGGEVQLVALARALILDPKILFLDEPTANLDGSHVHRFERLLSETSKQRKMTIVMTSHNFSQAYRMTDRVFSLFEGSLVSSTMQNLFSGKTRETPEGPCFDTGTIRMWILPRAYPVEATHASIDPKNIIASKEPFDSSARNQFEGVITEIVDRNGKILLGVQSEENFRVQITDLSLRKMGLTIGSRVFITFKASSVHLL